MVHVASYVGFPVGGGAGGIRQPPRETMTRNVTAMTMMMIQERPWEENQGVVRKIHSSFFLQSGSVVLFCLDWIAALLLVLERDSRRGVVTVVCGGVFERL